MSCLARARAHAEATDAARARGEDRPLLGLPMTLKQSMNVRDLATTCGMAEWREARVEASGPVAERVAAAGAVLLGKPNEPPMLAD